MCAERVQEELSRLKKKKKIILTALLTPPISHFQYIDYIDARERFDLNIHKKLAPPSVRTWSESGNNGMATPEWEGVSALPNQIKEFKFFRDLFTIEETPPR